MEYVVGIGEYIISANQEDVVKTFALSTCVGIVIYDINKKNTCNGSCFIT